MRYLIWNSCLLALMPKLPLTTHELLWKGRWVSICIGNGLIQAMGPWLSAIRRRELGKGLRRACCRLGHSGWCGGVSHPLAALGGCIKVISMDSSCYSYVASSKNSSLYPNIQLTVFSRVCFVLVGTLTGSISSFASISRICSRTSSLLQDALLFH